MSNLLLRFFLGAAVVSAFSLVGEALKPKRFSGVFGAAPSIALVTLAMTFSSEGRKHLAIEGRSMIAGGVAFAAYCNACVVAATRAWCPLWSAAGAAWALWGGVAFCAWRVVLASGIGP